MVSLNSKPQGHSVVTKHIVGNAITISHCAVLVNGTAVAYPTCEGKEVNVHTIGARLRYARLRKVWTQEDLARESGVPVVTISRIENGHSRNTRQTTVRKLAGPLGIDPAWLMFGDGEPDAKLAA